MSDLLIFQQVSKVPDVMLFWYISFVTQSLYFLAFTHESLLICLQWPKSVKMEQIWGCGVGKVTRAA